MAIRPYIAFAGNCREAFTRYQEIFGGELTLFPTSDMPPDAGRPVDVDPDSIMHAQLMFDGDTLMGADDVMGGYQGKVNGMCVNCERPSVADAQRVFAALAEGGEIQMPIGETFFSPMYGMCIDRFGTPWHVMAPMPEPG
jgi:PhnB protein